jgi:hypothetical protein
MSGAGERSSRRIVLGIEDPDQSIVTRKMDLLQRHRVRIRCLYALEQVHLTGYDTLIRIFNSKYYPPEHTLKPLRPSTCTLVISVPSSKGCHIPQLLLSPAPLIARPHSHTFLPCASGAGPSYGLRYFDPDLQFQVLSSGTYLETRIRCLYGSSFIDKIGLFCDANINQRESFDSMCEWSRSILRVTIL